MRCETMTKIHWKYTMFRQTLSFQYLYFFFENMFALTFAILKFLAHLDLSCLVSSYVGNFSIHGMYTVESYWAL
jgi:hypothetical protein